MFLELTTIFSSSDYTLQIVNFYYKSIYNKQCSHWLLFWAVKQVVDLWRMLKLMETEELRASQWALDLYYFYY